MKERFKAHLSVYLILLQGERVLLHLRQNTGYADGQYSLVAGHLDGNESAKDGMIREAYEEAGIRLSHKDLVASCIMHRKTEEREVIDFFFSAKSWENEVTNCEPHKCKELVFFPIKQLPENTVPYVARGIQCFSNGMFFDQYGWEKELFPC